MKLFTKTLAASLCTAAFTMAAPQVFAASVNLTSVGAVGTAPEMVVRVPGDPAVKMYVSAFNEHVNSVTGSTPFTVGQNLLAWCLEVALHKGTTGNYIVNELTGAATPTWVDALGQLFTRFGSLATGGAGAAAMQLAIWEVVGDSGSTYDLNSGDFQASSTGSSKSNAAWNLADGWLNTLNTSAPVWNHYRIVALNYDDVPAKQDLVTFIPTPLPGAALLFLSALGLGGLARRKQAAGKDALAA